MIEKFPIPDVALPPPLGFSFVVFFYPIQVGPVPLPLPNPLDIRFQSVSGISKDFSQGSQAVQENHRNGEHLQLAGRGTHNNLVLERGIVVGPSLLKIELEAALLGETGTAKKQMVHVMLMNELMVPIGNWFFRDAYPVSWSFTGLDATQSQVVIERIEMRYSSFYTVIL